VQVTTLGASGLRVSKVALGCGHLGKRVRGTQAQCLIGAAMDLGVNLFDTADVYAAGDSERELGKALGNRRDQCVVATKVGHCGPVRGASRKSLRLAVENSLRRLSVDYIDLLQIHTPDPATPIEETIGALQNLVERGLILYYGLSNVSAWQVVDAQRVAWSSPGAALTGVQIQINLVDHRKWDELRVVVDRFGIGILAASPLARGLLGGAYDHEHHPPEGHPLLSAKGLDYWTDAGIATARRVGAVAGRRGWTPARTALAALLARKEVAAVLVGAHSPEQLPDLCAAGSDELDKSEFRLLWTPERTLSTKYSDVRDSRSLAASAGSGGD
jgi:1-deoxyxylulose-5-phosphate synthase